MNVPMTIYLSEQSLSKLRMMSDRVIIRTACLGVSDSQIMSVDDVQTRLSQASSLQEIGWWMKQLSRRMTLDAKKEIDKLVHDQPTDSYVAPNIDKKRSDIEEVAMETADVATYMDDKRTDVEESSDTEESLDTEEISDTEQQLWNALKHPSDVEDDD